MNQCCGKFHVGWVCPRCGKGIQCKSHVGNDPVPISKVKPPVVNKNITVVKGDYVKGSVIKDSVVMGDVNTNAENDSEIVVTQSVSDNQISDSFVFLDDLGI